MYVGKFVGESSQAGDLNNSISPPAYLIISFNKKYEI